MKLDVNVLRYLSKEEFRVLTAVEMGMKNVHVLLAVSLPTWKLSLLHMNKVELLLMTVFFFFFLLAVVRILSYECWFLVFKLWF
jgi:RIO-like serine/threonine protein kinase